jgi:hypothetical protein
MSEPTVCAAACCRSIRPDLATAGYCVNCDLLVGLPGLHVVAVEWIQLCEGEGSDYHQQYGRGSVFRLPRLLAEHAPLVDGPQQVVPGAERDVHGPDDEVRRKSR